MHNFLLYGPVRDQAGIADGTSSDPGMPFVHGEKPPEPKPSAKEKTPEQIELDELRRENKRLNSRVREVETSERHWQQKAQQYSEVRPQSEDPEPEPVSRRRERAPEKPEKFLDDVTAEGLDALKKRGVITQEDFEEEWDRREKKLREEMRAELDGARADVNFASSFQAEFPEVVADNRKIEAWKKGGSRGEAPQVSELSAKTAEVFNDMIAEDPELANRQATLTAAARMAKRLLAAEGKGNVSRNNDREDPDDRRPSRRERIDDQRSPRGSGSEEGESTPHLSSAARQVIGNLRDFGATEQGFTGTFSKHGDVGRSRR